MLRATLPLLAVLTLTACGMKGDLYLPPPPTEEPEATGAPPAEPTPADATDDRGERRQIPPAPSPDLSR